MNRSLIIKVAVTSVLYLLTFVLCSSLGLFHPACYAYAGTVFPLLTAFIYFYVAAYVHGFGAALILNGFALAVALIAGEGNAVFIAGMIVLTVLAEYIRKVNGYDSLRGVRLSFLPLAYSFYAYAAHWWTDTARSLAEAVEEMPVGYADKMLPVIQNKPLLMVMLVLTEAMAMIAVRLAERVLKKEAAILK